MKKIIMLLSSIRFVPHIVTLLLLYRNNLIWEDAKFWMKCYSKKFTGVYSIFYLLIKFKEFRTLFYYRCPFAKIFKFFAQGEKLLYINTKNIGKGLFIQHGFSTIINAKQIGEFCWINQQVTIGWTAAGNPSIGNNVRIGAGAIIIGNIKIGDNVTVGAGTTVNTSISANSLIVGAKPRIIEDHIVQKQ